MYKRDMDYVRQLLLDIEKQGYYASFVDEGEDASKLQHHLEIMADVGLVTAPIEKGPMAYYEFGTRLTWEGHEFLEVIRDDDRWERIKVEMAKGGSFVYEIIKSMALDFLEEDINPNRVRSLRSQLIQRYKNLHMMQEQAADYAASRVPVDLLNQIEAEQKAIDEIERKLKLLTD